MSLELFIQPEESIKINFAVCASKSDPKVIYADVSAEKLKEIYGDDIDEPTIETHNAVFRRPNFEDMTRLYDGAFVFKGEEMRSNASSLRMNKIAILLKSWSLGLPANPDSVRKLNSTVAIVIGSELDRQTS